MPRADGNLAAAFFGREKTKRERERARVERERNARTKDSSWMDLSISPELDS